MQSGLQLLTWKSPLPVALEAVQCDHFSLTRNGASLPLTDNY